MSEDQESGDRGRRRREGGCGESGEDGGQLSLTRGKEGQDRYKGQSTIQQEDNNDGDGYDQIQPGRSRTRLLVLKPELTRQPKPHS